MPAAVIAIALLAAAIGGCAGGPAPAWPPAPGALKDVWLVGHGWHTRVAVAREDVDPTLWPESRDLGDVRYLEVGWGDRDFYPDPSPSLWDALDPVVRCTPAALHVGGLDRPPAGSLAGAEIVHLRVSADGFDRLTRFIHRHYVHDPADRPVRIRPGHYPRSWFYLAEGRYHVLHNSNTWTATALREAGVPVAPWRAVTAHGVLGQAARFGHRP